MKRLILAVTTIIIVFTFVACGTITKTQLSEVQEYLDLGQKYLLDGDYEQAIVAFEKVIEIEPKNVDAYLGLADVYVQMGDYESAIAVLEQGYAETNNAMLFYRISELRDAMANNTAVPEVTTVPKMTTVEPDPEEDKIADIVWTLEDGVLTIRGEGRMPDYGYFDSPWYERSDEIVYVTISDGITSIGEAVFASCYNLISITVAPGNQYFYTDDRGALFQIDGSKLLWYPACNEESHYDIPNGIIRIGVHAFNDCYNLTSITIPDSVTSIGKYEFEGCYELISITVAHENQYYYSDGRGALFQKEGSKLLCYPAGNEETHYDIPNGVRSIGKVSFERCKNLISITIPNSVTSIENYAFRSCWNLTSITIPGSVTSIGDGAFNSCDLESVIIHDGVTSIGNRAFVSCYGLTSIKIPDSVTSIGQDAFGLCDKLIICAPVGSYAEQYAKENGIPFVAQ